MIIIAATNKILFVMRGCPGSGKSSTAKKLGEGGVVLSTDDFFVEDGRYVFNPTRLGEAHDWNIKRALKAISEGVSPIVIDNTNVLGWQAKPYVQAALAAGYDVKIAEPSSPWWKKHKPGMSDEEKTRMADELGYRNEHGVPADVIRKMLDSWEHGLTPEGIMESRKPEIQP